ncbi:hypothetical protein [Encephalitozoon cuniculi GB-M1]|uniref:Uncharacterized protein n=1 Tax=Encephalitozoon cuniculi (strain GB-M1) TaxID=284813 RepID=Q8SU75_ENCCU|nr:uncharacterized protein ECU11_0380 [Encephalitozoon cuniculi GB-M1]CAD25948.1 hypothetical protein [Encephalitozoon cuniculi GB-M1]
MERSSKEDFRVSRPNLDGESTGRVYFPFDIIRCRICFEVFHAKHHKSHPCFLKDVDRQGDRETGSILAEGRNEKPRSKGSLKSMESTINVEEDFFRDPGYLAEALNISPVVNKIWRLSRVSLSREKSLVGIDRRKYRGKWKVLVPQTQKTMGGDPSWTRR